MSNLQTSDVLLKIRGLRVDVPRRGGPPTALVNGLDLDIKRGEIFGLIGETGAGKSMTAWATIDLLPNPARVAGGKITFNGEELTPSTVASVRGRSIGIVMQNPRAAFNPMRTVGAQMATVLRAHSKLSRTEAKHAVVEALRSVGIAEPATRASAYPHELSGGMAQRAMIAMALLSEPGLIIADEPTTGLDATVQAQILDLLKEKVESTGTSVLLITHDLGVVANYTHRAGVMFAGDIVEAAPTRELFANPQHPYSRELIYTLEADEAALHPNAGKPPNLIDRPAGCQYAYRCLYAQDRCVTPGPSLVDVGANHVARCVLLEQQSPAGQVAETQVSL